MSQWKQCVCAWQFEGPPADRQAACSICVFKVPVDDEAVYQERLADMEGA